MSRRIHNIMSGADTSWSAAWARLGLGCLVPAYRLGNAARQAMFNLGLRKPRKLPRRVVSLGNITTGGTGKTPMTIELARRSMAMGKQPAVLMRGYGDDESHELTQRLEALAVEFSSSPPLVEADPDRYAAGHRALDRSDADIDVFILDDGFQHRQLHRDLDLVLIDATEPFGYDHLLPRGMLREPLEALRRATGVIVTRCDQIEPDELDRISKRIGQHHGRQPLALASHDWTGYDVRRSDQDTAQPLDALASRSVIAACGIGNPAAFERDLRKQVGGVIDLHVFADHHAYRPDELRPIIGAARAGGHAIVTTAKDWTKWRQIPVVTESDVPIFRPKLEIVFREGEGELDRMLHDLFE